MSRPHALKAPPWYLYLVQRQDFGPHSSDDNGRLYIHSIHTTKAAANKKARVLIRVIRRDEDYTDIAVLETEKLDETGHYYGYLKLHQDESDVEAIHHVEVTVVEEPWMMSTLVHIQIQKMRMTSLMKWKTRRYISGEDGCG
jgi:hypothetical protein